MRSWSEIFKLWFLHLTYVKESWRSALCTALKFIKGTLQTQRELKEWRGKSSESSGRKVILFSRMRPDVSMRDRHDRAIYRSARRVYKATTFLTFWILCCRSASSLRLGKFLERRLTQIRMIKFTPEFSYFIRSKTYWKKEKHCRSIHWKAYRVTKLYHSLKAGQFLLIWISL